METIDLKLNKEQINLLITGLSELKWKDSNALITDITNQYRGQLPKDKKDKKEK